MYIDEYATKVFHAFAQISFLDDFYLLTSHLVNVHSQRVECK